MRRIYYTDSKRKKIEQDALSQLRQTLSQLDPRLLDQIREVIAVRQPEKEDLPEDDDLSHSPSKVPVDHKKNLRTIMKFLELKPGSREFQKKIYDLLAQEM